MFHVLSIKQVRTTSQMVENEERWRRINTLSHPPSSSGHSPSSVVLSDGAGSESAERRGGEGEGSGSCGSHFIKQPEIREMLIPETKPGIWIHWAGHAIKCSLQCFSKSDWNGCTLTLISSVFYNQRGIMVTALTTIPLLFVFLILHRSLSLYDELALCSTIICPWLYWASYRCVVVCVSVYSPTRSGSLSLSEAPVIVGGLLLWREQKLQHESCVSSGHSRTVLRCNFWFARCFFCVWWYVMCLSVIYKIFSVSLCLRFNKGLQLETNICMLRHPRCSESCGA